MLNQLTPLSNVIERSTREGLLTHIFNTTLSIMLPRLATSGTSPRRTPDTTGQPNRDERHMDSQRQHARDTCSEHLTPLELPLEERPAEIGSPSDQAHMARLQPQSLNFEFVMEPTTSRLKLAVIDGSIQTDPKQLMGYAATAEAAGLASEAEAVWQFLLSNAPDATTAALDGDLPASLLSAIRDFIERDPYEFHDRGDIQAALTSFKKEPGRTHIAEMANDVRCQLLKNKDRTKHQQITMIRATQFLAGFPDLFGKIFSGAPMDAFRMARILHTFKNGNWEAACNGATKEIIACRDSLTSQDIEYLTETMGWRQVELITNVANMIKNIPSTELEEATLALRKCIGFAPTNAFEVVLFNTLKLLLDEWSRPDAHLNAS
jgi:hypothetical protein